MSFTITVAQRKGGVGKTTLAVGLAAELNRRRGKTALIDADSQQSACQWAKLGKLQFPIYEMALIDQTSTNWIRALARVTKDYDYVVIDTAPAERPLGVSMVISSLILVPCTPSGLDLDATARTLEMVDIVRARRQGAPRLILVPNRVDSRTLEGRQLVAELAGFGEIVSESIGHRAAFVRAFTAGTSVAEIPEGPVAQQEMSQLCDLVERHLR